MIAALETEMVRLLHMTDEQVLDCFQQHSLPQLKAALSDLHAPRPLAPVANWLAKALDIDLDAHRQRFSRLLQSAIDSRS